MTGMRLFADLCGTELWNVERFRAYLANGVSPAGMRYKGSGCPALADLVPLLTGGDGPTGGYALPELDPAPWYDPLLPESQNFAGVLVTKATLGQPLDRDFFQNAGPGGTLTYPRLQGRTLDVEATLVGRTCCATQHGLRWLTQALLGGSPDACDECDMTFLTCCPCEPGDECLVVDGEPYYRPTPDDEWARGLDFGRQLKRVGVLQAPTVVGVSGRSCGCGCGPVAQVEFTLAASLPWVTTLGTTLEADLPVGGCDDDCIVFVKCTEEAAASGCPELSDCASDPVCASGAPEAPAFPAPRRKCGCVPLSALRTWVEVPAASAWFPQALKVEVSAGSELLRNLVLRVFDNPDGLPCEDGSFPDCEASGTLLVDYVPAGGTFTFDSSARRATMECDGATWPADLNLSTVEGLPFGWLDLGSGAACLAIDSDCNNVADDASVTVTAVRREL